MSRFRDLVKGRRSTRKYLNKKIGRQDLESCVEAGRLAPSACNAQPWKFLIIDDENLKQQIAKNAFSGIYGMNYFVSAAAAFIIIITEKQRLFPKLGGMAMRTDFRLIDIGLACENIVLQAQDLDIGTCILGWYNEKAIKKILSIPRSRNIALVIALGYSTEIDKKERKLKDFNETVSYNGY